MTARTKKVWLILALVLPAAFMVAASHLHRTTWAPILFSAFLLVPLWYFNRGMRETERVQVEAAKIIDRLLAGATDPDVIADAVEWLRKHASYIVPLTAQTRALMAAKQRQLTSERMAECAAGRSKGASDGAERQGHDPAAELG
jgi:hypothetical protein